MMPASAQRWAPQLRIFMPLTYSSMRVQRLFSCLLRAVTAFPQVRSRLSFSQLFTSTHIQWINSSAALLACIGSNRTRVPRSVKWFTVETEQSSDRACCSVVRLFAVIGDVHIQCFSSEMSEMSRELIDEKSY